MCIRDSTGKWINKDIHTGVDSLLTDQNPIPLHAGIYTASITKPDANSSGNTQNPVTASVEYTIAKADQPAPAKPDYTPPDAGGKTVTINKLAADPTQLTDKAGGLQEAKAQYRLNYSGSSGVDWEYIAVSYTHLDVYKRQKQNCRIPVYNRVNHDGQSWTAYVTNNTDVKAVSTNWETAAANSGRKSTPNKITFQSESGYSADVTIDNIWSDYHVRDANRTTGGITADLGTHIGTTIKLQLKGDNRFGNIHYYAKKGTNNKIIFSDGEGGSAPEGGITVADFTKNFGANYWCSAIGGNDNGHDPSDGIVIKSGVIYAGTTSVSYTHLDVYKRQPIQTAETSCWMLW